MSRAPYVMLKPAAGYARGTPEVADTVLGWRFVNPRFPARYTVQLGETAELVAAKYGVTREDQDRFACAASNGGSGGGERPLLGGTGAGRGVSRERREPAGGQG
jgi:acetyl-CoA acetyltransferase